MKRAVTIAGVAVKKLRGLRRGIRYKVSKYDL